MNANANPFGQLQSPLAAEREPTDDELHVVMREARDVALQRKAESIAHLRERIAQAVAGARAASAS